MGPKGRKRKSPPAGAPSAAAAKVPARPPRAARPRASQEELEPSLVEQAQEGDEAEEQGGEEEIDEGQQEQNLQGADLEEEKEEFLNQFGSSAEYYVEQWRAYDTLLILAWLMDYNEIWDELEKQMPGISPTRHVNRRRLLWFMETCYARVRLPKSLAEAQENWCHHNDLEEPDDSTPGLWAPPQGAARPVTPPSLSRPSAAAVTPLPATQRRQEQEAPRSASRPLPPPLFDAAEADVSRACLSCLTPGPAGFAPWICKGSLGGIPCLVRGDLPHNDEFNREIRLAQRAAAAAATGKPAAAAADTDSSGQSTDARGSGSATSAAKQTKLNAAMDRERAENPQHPLFVRPSTTTEEQESAAVRAALATLRQSFDAKALVYPSPSLIKLIQSGCMLHVGFAVPIKSGATPADDRREIGFDTAGGGLTASLRVDIPKILSGAALTEALMMNILPALIARPTAQMQWLALSRTVLAFEQRHGWELARAYMESLLEERIRDQAPFSDVDMAMLTQRLMALGVGQPAPAAPRFGAAPGPASTQQRPAPFRSNAPCRDWQNGRNCPRGAACPHRHVCMRCFADHVVSECTRAALPAAPASYGGRPSGGSYSGKRRDAYGSGGGASVTTAPLPAKSAAASSSQGGRHD